MSLKFEWDKNKSGLNFKKHKVSFEEASTIFDDPFAVIFDDDDHSIEEHREIIIGYSKKRRLLLVFFTEVAEKVVRIFSARKANRRECKDYEENIYF